MTWVGGCATLCLPLTFSPLPPPPPPLVKLTLFSDASLEGWGGTDDTSHVGGGGGGGGGLMMNHLSWSSMQPNSPCWLLPQICHTPISAWCWTTLHYIDNALSIWRWAAKDRNIWLSTAFIPGVENRFSFPESLGQPVVFKQLTALSFIPEVDLFASRLNCQITPFVSWKPEPGAWVVNAFPPFNILGRVLAKVQQDGATWMFVTPFWSTQPWFPHLLELLIDQPRMLLPRKDLQLNGRLDMVQPLHSKLALLVMIISGQPSKVQAYQQWLQPF